MGIEKAYTTKLAVDGVTIDRRDITMLEAIDEYGSMHHAAEELGRSYARVQNRIVELEESVGAVTNRRRGGSGGGGTDLTQTARDLCQRFERHAAELDSVARVTESVFTGTVQDRSGELAAIETAIGSILAVVPEDATDVEVSVRSDAVILTDPSEAPDSDGTSLRNQFTGPIAAIDAGDAIDRVTVSLAADASLHALITRASRDRLALEPGQEIAASFKATAARGVSVGTGGDHSSK